MYAERTKNETFTNSVDPDQTAHNAAYDQGLYFCIKYTGNIKNRPDTPFIGSGPEDFSTSLWTSQFQIEGKSG